MCCVYTAINNFSHVTLSFMAQCDAAHTTGCNFYVQQNNTMYVCNSVRLVDYTDH